MKKTRMRVWSILLTVLMLLTLLPISAMAEEAPVAMIGETTYTSLYDAVAAAKDGDTIKLLGNASGRGIIIDSSKYAETGLTIDFNGFTYTVDESPLAGSPGTESQCFQLLTGGKVTMKGGTVNSTNTGVAMVLQNYCDLTLDGMVIDGSGMTGTGTYTMSNNCGNVVIKDTTVIAKEGDVAFDVYGGFQKYGDVTVTVTGSSVIDGKVEVARGNGTQNKNTLNIEGGTFNNEIVVTDNEKTSVTVSGGAFSKVPTDYIGEDVTQFVCNGVTYVGTSAVDGAHSWKLISTLKPATCTADGLGKFACEYCDATKYAIIPAEHTWELTETVKEATCGEAGQAKYTCSVCGETKNEEIPATGEHDFEESLVDATCTENAKVGMVCKNCGATEGEMEEVPETALGHDLQEDPESLVEPTCTEAGSVTLKCSRCDYTEEKTLDALGHTPGEPEMVEPTCTESGKSVVKCTVCGAEIESTDLGELAPATGHTPVAMEEVAATCTTAGSTGGSICSVCGEVLEEPTAVPVNPEAHNYVLTSTLKEPTCTTTGIGKYTCSYCSASKYEVIGAEHKWNEGEITKEATCTEAGEMIYTCTVCGATKTDEIPALGHDWDEGEITTPATCGTAGEMTYTCQRDGCDATKTEVIEATGEHTPGEGYTEATCTENAKAGTVCEVCGAELGEMTELPGTALGHDLIEDEETLKPATCTEAGSVTLKCSRCDYTEEKTLDALGHTPGEPEMVEPTCTENGKSVVKCAVCGEILESDDLGELAPATGHTPVAMEEVAATCTTAGSTGGVICSACEAVLEEPTVVPANPDTHVYQLEKTLKEPTCSAPGIGSYKCECCGKTAYLSIEPLEHTWDEGTVTKEPTCTEDGEKTVTCTVCGAEDTVLIPNLGGHQWVEDLVDDVTNVVYKECGVCGQREITWSANDDLKNCFEGKHTPVEIPETETHYAGSKCSVCGTILEEPLAKCDHENTQLVNAVEATCTENGYTGDLVCQDCRATLETGKAIPAAGHTEEVIPGKEATCTETGLTEGKKCSVCGEVLTAQEEIPATGHTEEVIPGKEATCTETGLTEGKKCSVCGEVLTAQEEIPAIGHTEEVIPGKEATCTETGLTEGKKCSVCGEVLVAQEEIPMVAHNYVDGVCTACGAEDPDYVAPCTHENTETKNAVAATCTEDGYTGDTVCTDCGETLQTGAVIPATGHTVVTDAAVEATCTTDGKTEGSHCSVCEAVITAQETIPAKGHTPVDVPEVPATEESAGTTAGTKCSVCGEILSGCETIPPLSHEHVWDDGVETKAPTCTEAGEMTYTCSCGETRVETIPAKGHSYKVSVSYNDDYSKIIYTYTCSACGDSYKEEFDL